MPYRKRSHRGEESRADWSIESLLYAILIGTPLALGTVHFWAVVPALVLSAALFGLVLVHLRRSGGQVRLLPLGLVLLVAALLTALQVVPLPPGVIAAVSPAAGEVYDEVLEGTPLADRYRTLSLAPPATALELMKLLSALFVFLSVVNYATDRRRAIRIYKTIAWSGFVVVSIGFFSKLFMAKKILGFHPLPRETFFFATFVNQNHLAGFLLLCSLVAVAVALSARERQDKALFGFMGAVIGMGVFLTLSRGGMIAYVVGIVFLLFFLASRQIELRRLLWAQGIAVLVLAGAAYLAYDAVLRELSTLGDPTAIEEEAKVRAWAAVGPMIADHPAVGIGRGAFATVYPRYKTIGQTSTFTHPENLALQVLSEWGIPTGGLFLVGLLVCFITTLFRLRQSGSQAACLAGILGVLLHNQVDFNLETGAVACAFFAVFALLQAAPFPKAALPFELSQRIRFGSNAGFALLALAVVGGGLSALLAGKGDLARLTQALLAKQDQAGPVEPCDGSPFGSAACDLLTYYPADYLAPLVVGRANLGGSEPRLPSAVRWLSTAMFLCPNEPQAHLLTGRALMLIGRKEQALLEYRQALRAGNSIHAAVVTEVLHFTASPDEVIAATPEEPEALLRTARVLRRFKHAEAAAHACRMALERNVAHLPCRDLLANITLEQGQLDEAAALAQQTTEIDPQHEQAWLVWARVLLLQNKTAEAEKLLRDAWAQIPDSTLIAASLVEHYLREQRFSEAEKTVNRMTTFVSSDDVSRGRMMNLLGRVKEARGQYVEARQAFRQAVDYDPTNWGFLYQLGRMEEKVGAWDEAARIFEKLRDAHFQEKEMADRLEALDKARQNVQTRARLQELATPPEE